MLCGPWQYLVVELKVIRLENSWNKENRTKVGCDLHFLPAFDHCWCSMLLWTFSKEKGCGLTWSWHIISDMGTSGFSYCTGLSQSHETFFPLCIAEWFRFLPDSFVTCSTPFISYPEDFLTFTCFSALVFCSCTTVHLWLISTCSFVVRAINYIFNVINVTKC